MVETGHTLILGWSEKGLAVLQQIALANMSEGGLPIVVLCSESKEAMASDAFIDLGDRTLRVRRLAPQKNG